MDDREAIPAASATPAETPPSPPSRAFTPPPLHPPTTSPPHHHTKLGSETDRDACRRRFLAAHRLRRPQGTPAHHPRPGHVDDDVVLPHRRNDHARLRPRHQRPIHPHG